MPGGGRGGGRVDTGHDKQEHVGGNSIGDFVQFERQKTNDAMLVQI